MNSLRCYSLYKTMYRPAEDVNRCQCCIYRVSLPDTQGSSDLFGNHDSPQIIHSSDNAGCFHISFSFSAGCKASLMQREVAAHRADGGIVFIAHYNPPVSSADSPLYTRGPFLCAYNNFTNYAVSICKGTQIIPQDLLFPPHLFKPRHPPFCRNMLK